MTRALLGNRRFLRFWAARVVSEIGDGVAVVAVPLVVLDIADDVKVLGLLRSALGCAGILGALAAGFVVDRIDRRRLMVACDVVRAALFLLVPIGFALRGRSLALVMGVAVTSALLETCFQVTQLAALPGIVERDALPAANGLVALSFGLSRLIGPTLAGVLSAHAGPVSGLALDAGTFIVSAALIATLPLERSRGPSRSEARAGPVAAVAFIIRTPALLACVCMLSVAAFGVAGGQELFIYRLRHDLKVGDAGIGGVFGVASLGAIAGAFAAPRLRRLIGSQASLVGILFVQGIFGVAFGWARGLGTAAAAAAGFAFTNLAVSVYVNSIRQELAPPALLGRITSSMLFLGLGFGAIGALSTASLAARLGARSVLVGIGVVLMLDAVVGAIAWTAYARAQKAKGGGSAEEGRPVRQLTSTRAQRRGPHSEPEGGQL